LFVLSKKEKDKKKKDKKEALKKIKVAENCKSKCCEKYKSENKRCSRCPMFDLFKK
jgi:hypothetical protein